MLLTDAEFVRKLDMLSLLARRMVSGPLKADRRTRRAGSGSTFADYSEYHSGDDFSAIDWNIFARLETLVIKLFELEEDARVYLLLDLSRSMARKLSYARQLAAAVGYIALNRLDYLSVFGMADQLKVLMPPGHGRERIMPFLKLLEQTDCFGTANDFDACVKSLLSRCRRPGICLLLSDFFLPGGYERGFDALRWGGHEIFCLEIIDPADERCEWRGDIELECVESGAARALTIGAAEAAAFTVAVRRWREQFHHDCKKRGIGWAEAVITLPFETVIRELLKKRGVAR